MSSVNGHIIVNTLIAVDIWKRGTDKYVHFLSHCHTDHTVGLSSTWRLPIYTTHFNAWMLKNKFRVKSHLLQCLSIGDNHIIRIPETGEEFTVTLIDANHCPGSAMFLFQGSFGTILYTGDFRYDPVMLENKMLARVIKNELLDVLYIDNTYASPYCKIPSRKEAAQQIVQIIRDHPQHKILLGLHSLGKEELLSVIALEFCEKICVSEDRLAILQKLQYEDVFTTDPEICRIHVVNVRSVTPSHMKKRQKEHPHIAILPTGLHMRGFDDENPPCINTARDGIHVVPYSDHSNYEELFTFISHLKPTKLYPIVKETKVCSKKVLNGRLIKTFHTFTDSLYQLCREKRQENTNCQNKELVVSSDTKEHKLLPANLCCNIKHKKSQHRPRIIQRKKLSKVFQKKGVQFESSFTSDDSDETLKTDGKHTTKLERKNNGSDVRGKLSDRYSVHGYCREKPSENLGGASSYTMPSDSSGGRISPSKNTDTESEKLGRYSTTYSSNTMNAQGKTTNTDQISFTSISDVTKPHTKSLVGAVESEQEFEDVVWSDSISVKEEQAQELDIKPNGENGDLSRHRTEDTVKYPMVLIPILSDTTQRLMESSELHNATEETQIHCQWTCPSGLRKRGWNKHPRCHSCSRDSGIIVSTKQKCVSLNIQNLPRPCFSCDIKATRACKAHGIKYQATQNTICESNFHKASDDRSQISSVKSLQTSDWSSAANMLQSDTGSLLPFSPASTLLSCSDTQCPTTSDDRIQITSVKSLQTSDWSSVSNMLQSDTGSLLEFSPAPTLLTCSDARCHKASDDRIQITSVKSLQTSEWSSVPNMLQSDTGSSLQFSPMPTLLTCSDTQSHDKGSLAITGCHTNSKKGKHIAFVTEENGTTSRLKTRDRITSNKGTRITSESCFSYSVEEPDKNSSVSQNEQPLNHRPLSSDVLQTDGLHKAAVQCEEILLSQNTTRITPSLQQMEVATAELAGMRSCQSDKSEEGTVARRKPISSEHCLSNISVGSKRNIESSSPETSVGMTNSANVGQSYSSRKRCNHNSDGQKNKATLRSDSILQNNNSNNNTGGQSIDQNVATVFADKSSEHEKHTKSVSNTPYNSKAYNRIPTDECEAPVCQGMPMSTYQEDCNYWTNGNRVPFAIHEVRQAIQHLPFQRSNTLIHNIINYPSGIRSLQ